MKLSPLNILSSGIGVLATLVLTSFAAQAQFKFTGFSVLSADGHGIPLPSEVGEMQTKGPNMAKMVVGYARTRTFIEIPGDRCSVRVSRGVTQAFLLGTETPWPEGQPLPPSLANLQSLTVEKGNRQLVMADITGTVLGAKSRTKRDGALGIHIDVTRQDDHAVKIVPRSALSRGEYAFMTSQFDGYTTSYRLYCFGVD